MFISGARCVQPSILPNKHHATKGSFQRQEFFISFPLFYLDAKGWYSISIIRRLESRRYVAPAFQPAVIRRALDEDFIMTQASLSRRSFILSASTAAAATIAGSVAHGFAANE